MALHSQALLLPYSETSISNTQLHRLYRPTPIRPKWRSGRLVVASAAPRRKEPSKEISLDQHDLMALEFGRLLGESKEKTISKVLHCSVYVYFHVLENHVQYTLSLSYSIAVCVVSV